MVLKILNPSTMKPFTLRDCGDTLVIKMDNIVIVLNKRLEKTHIALKSLEIGLTLDAPLEAINGFERLLKKRLKKLVVVSEDPEEVGSVGGCLGLLLAGELWIGWAVAIGSFIYGVIFRTLGREGYERLQTGSLAWILVLAFGWGLFQAIYGGVIPGVPCGGVFTAVSGALLATASIYLALGWAEGASHLVAALLVVGLGFFATSAVLAVVHALGLLNPISRNSLDSSGLNLSTKTSYTHLLFSGDDGSSYPMKSRAKPTSEPATMNIMLFSCCVHRL
jgi:hypothetical protein